MRGSAELIQYMVSVGGEFVASVEVTQPTNRISFHGRDIAVHPCNYEQLLKDLETYKQITNSPLIKALL